MYTINIKRSEFALLINALNELQPDQPAGISSINDLIGNLSEQVGAQIKEAMYTEPRAGGLADRELIYSAEIPKQPITRPFNITLRQKEDRHGVTWSTHQEYRDEQGGADHGHYDMGLSEAERDYAIRVTQAMRYANVQGIED